MRQRDKNYSVSDCRRFLRDRQAVKKLSRCHSFIHSFIHFISSPQNNKTKKVTKKSIQYSVPVVVGDRETAKGPPRSSSQAATPDDIINIKYKPKRTKKGPSLV